VSRYCAQTLEGIALGHESTVWDIAFTADGKYMASVSDDRAVKVWRCEYQNGEPLFKLDATLTGYHARSIFGVSWSSSGALATACGAQLVLVLLVVWMQSYCVKLHLSNNVVMYHDGS
jgi:WD40 repeat protein